MENKYWLTILVSIGAFAAFFVFVFIHAANLQKDTCRRTIEFSFIVGINTNKIKLETLPNSDWKKLNSTERLQLLNFVENHRSEFTECSDYLYLIRGEESDGTEMSFYTRKDDLNRIEFRLGE